MVFSSNLFLFCFLPAFLLLYFVTPAGGRNTVILVAGVLFYAFGSGIIAWILVASVVFNDVAARLIHRCSSPLRDWVFAVAVTVNLVPLFYYKYLGFSANLLFDAGIPIDPSPYRDIVLPVGISFFTFQAISYVSDVHGRAVPPARTLLEFGMYHTLFPQLVAGPIVRYAEIRREIDARRFDLENVAEGAFRFCMGLGKKVLLADQLALVVDHIFKLPASELTPAVAWIGLACFSLQIYLDFSGYSDMAIGLGRMLGFRFPENFDQPYRASSVTEFWRRWHMTLTRWFRDYVYVPLGGNRQGPARTYSNLCLIFVLCGLWHGAAMTFLAWGLYHGALLAIERALKTLAGWTSRGWPGMVLTVFLVTIGWIPFRSPDLGHSASFAQALFGLVQPGNVYFPAAYYLTPANATCFALGLLIAFFPRERLCRLSTSFAATRYAGAVAVFVLSVIALSASSFRPFIYFQF